MVIKSTGSRYKIFYGEDRTIECTLKGSFRFRGIRTTNPVAVGDNVIFRFEDNANSGVITEILERRNYILRKASNLSKEVRLLQLMLIRSFLC